MTKKERRKSTATVKKTTRRHVGEDPIRLIAELSPGKKGGEYELPFGGQVNIPGGILGKKDVITCCMMSPSDRYKYMPPLRRDEHLLSEIFLIATSVKNIKKELELRLPHKQPPSDLFNVEMLWKQVEADEWQDKEFESSAKGRYVEFSTLTGGIFAVVGRPRSETFEIPVQGCLYNSKLSHQVSVRFPKKATNVDLTASIVITPMNRASLPGLIKDHPIEMADLLALSDYVTIRPDQPCVYFKRAATVKLPLPQLPDDEFPEDDMVVLEWSEEMREWELLETSLKFTKSSVMFDTHSLGRYCVALAAPQRRKRLVNTFRFIHKEDQSIRGQVLPFVHIQEKLWTLFVEVTPNDKVDEVIARRQEEGFQLAERVEVIPEVIEDKLPPRLHKTKPPEPKPERADLDLTQGRVFNIELTGDILLNTETNPNVHKGLYYHHLLDENYRKFFIEPKLVSEYVDVTATLKINAIYPDNNLMQPQCLRSFDINVGAEKVENFFYEPPPTPTPEPEPAVVLDTSEENVSAPETIEPTPVPSKPSCSRPPTASFLRLTTPIKPMRTIFREAKVLSGRSLKCLAKEIEQGLTLAIHLDISDSCITGLGFDALANGLSLTEITYRILLLWKRRTTRMKNAQVHMLLTALQEMGRNDAASIVAEQHRLNRELTPECFEIPRPSEGDSGGLMFLRRQTTLINENLPPLTHQQPLDDDNVPTSHQYDDTHKPGSFSVPVMKLGGD